MGERDRNYQSQIQEQADAQQMQAQKQIDIFMKEYPEFKDKGPEVLDPKVFEYVKEGYTLLEAYNKYQRESIANDAKVKASKLNEENKKKALGNTSTAGSAEEDAFLSGFNS